MFIVNPFNYLHNLEVTEMRELEKKLKALQKQGYEQINIGQVIQWMYDIRRENAVKKIERDSCCDTPELDKSMDMGFGKLLCKNCGDNLTT